MKSNLIKNLKHTKYIVLNSVYGCTSISPLQIYKRIKWLLHWYFVISTIEPIKLTPEEERYINNDIVMLMQVF